MSTSTSSASRDRLANCSVRSMPSAKCSTVVWHACSAMLSAAEVLACVFLRLLPATVELFLECPSVLKGLAGFLSARAGGSVRFGHRSAQREKPRFPCLPHGSADLLQCALLSRLACASASALALR